MALKALPLERVEAHRLDDPRRPARPAVDSPSTTTPTTVPADLSAASQPDTAPSQRSAQRTAGRRRARKQPKPSPSPATAPEVAGPVNPYAHAGRPHQVALSLFTPQWERIEEQCAELRAEGVRDANVTRWLFAVLEFRAPADTVEAQGVFRRWVQIENDDTSMFHTLSRQARGIRLYEPLWQRQQAIVGELRKSAASPRPTLALWTSGVVELCGPKSADEARVLLRELRQLLAGDPG